MPGGFLCYFEENNIRRNHHEFFEIANARQSCRSYDEERSVKQDKPDTILEAVRLSPSACNGQPYHITVCRGEAAKEITLLTRGEPYFSFNFPIKCS